jgi:hypothetical protein
MVMVVLLGAKGSCMRRLVNDIKWPLVQELGHKQEYAFNPHILKEQPLSNSS